MIDVSAEHLAIIEKILLRRVPRAKVMAFGSRVAGNAVDYSDLDLAIEADGKLDLATLGNLKADFDDSEIPFRMDVLDFNAVSPEFREIIKSHCETILLPAACQGEAK